MKRRVTTVLLLLWAIGAFAQNVSDLIVSEVLALPDSASLVDDHGRRTGWIELFNTSTGTVNVGGCYLTDDPANLRKSPISREDLKTQVGPRQYVLFHASGHPEDGTFHTGFTLQPGSTVYLVSNDGRTIIDSLRVPAHLPAGRSVTKTSTDLRGQRFVAVPEAVLPTPGSAYRSDPQPVKADRMAASDPHGFTLSLVSVSVVFVSLAVLWGLFSLLFRLIGRTKAPQKSADDAPAPAPGTPTPEEAAAIAAALHLHLDAQVHDTESYRLTIRVPETSDWNDKQQLFRKLPTLKS